MCLIIFAGLWVHAVFAARHHYLIDHHLPWGINLTVLAGSLKVVQLAQVEGLVRELRVFLATTNAP